MNCTSYQIQFKYFIIYNFYEVIVKICTILCYNENNLQGSFQNIKYCRKALCTLVYQFEC